ncbi:MAG: hypothetical protein JWN79_3076 [Gemmatimonadetes bacterium]|jgi:hypothetical protein|nr:hypothetical protein [Gemmatimonadota bacterium]
MHDFMKALRTIARGAGALGLVASLAGSAGAQQSTAPWRAWLGCWSAGAATPLGTDPSAPLVCVTPTGSADAVRIVTVADGKVVSTQTVDVSGREVPLDAKGCSGTQTGRWSADSRRVYLNATANCDGVLRTTNGILAITATGDWLDIQGMKVGGTENVRVARYRDVGVPKGVPAEIAESIRGIDMSVAGAQVIAGADIGTAAVVEAAKATSVGVAEAFVLERGQHFSLDARQLIALADAGVPSRLTDAMIAVSNPQTFAVNRPAPPSRDTVYADGTGRRVYVTLDRYASPWGWGYDPYGYSRYGYSPYGYNAYNSGYGYGGYAYPGYVYGGPVVIVRGSEAATPPHGRMVKGRGYEQPSASTASPAPDRVRTAQPARENTGSSSGAQSSGASGNSSSGSSDRTAKPRP